MKAQRNAGVFALLFLLMLGAFALALKFGTIELSFTDVWEAMWDKQHEQYEIIWNLRMPRAIGAAIVGATLAVSGAIMQGVMRNPLADPNIVGVSSGAGLVGTLLILVFPAMLAYLPIAAFIGALVTSAIVYFLSYSSVTSIARIVLVGIAINATIGAATSLIMMLYNDRIQMVMPWISGGMSFISWHELKFVAIYVLIAFCLLPFCVKPIELLALGDEVAQLVGHSVNRSRFFLIAISSLFAAISVSLAGLVGFVGLVVPHIIRLWITHQTAWLLPLSAVGGALLVLVSDTVARTIFSPVEIPVGILLAFLGGPFFLYLVKKGGNTGA
ncbi:MAG: FecCD family ABC transporter permease [Bacilli bacterium]